MVEVQYDGDVNVVPCAGKTFLLNGSPLATAFTVSGTSRTNYFPVFSTENNLAKSPFSWNGSLYTWQNAAFDAQFRMQLTPHTSGGSFLVGDFDTTPTTWLDLNAASNYFQVRVPDGRMEMTVSQFEINQLHGRISFGDLDEGASGLRFDVKVDNEEFSFNSGSGLGALVFGVGNVIINAGDNGIPGNVTIHKAAGKVYLAAAATQVTVTNQFVNANSMVHATVQTNDATCRIANVVPGTESFVIRMTAACTGTTAVSFLVLNQL